MTDIQDPALDSLNDFQAKVEKWDTGFFPPYFRTEMTKRIGLLSEANKSKALQKSIKEVCSKDLILFTSTFVFTLDPRLVAQNKPALVPFIPFPKQIDYLNLRLSCIETGDNTVLLKSRDAGASYIALIHQSHSFLFNKNATTGLLSKKIDLVDRLGDANTLFEKLRQIFKYFPKWLLPLDKDYFSGFARMVNYEKNNSIVGFSGEDAGRSGRAYFLDWDEVAFCPYAESQAMAMSQTTNVLFLTSTPNGKNNYFAKQYLTSNWKKIFIHWKDDPRKDQAWYEKQCEKLDPRSVAIEIDGSFEESSEGAIFIYKHLEKCLNAFDQLYSGGTPIISAGLDISLGKLDECVFTILVAGCIVKEQIVLKEPDLVSLAYKVHQLCCDYNVDVLGLDTIGIGEGVSHIMARMNKRYDLVPIRGNAACTNQYFEEYDAKAKDLFRNLRAEMYYSLARKVKNTFQFLSGLRQWDQTECISFILSDYTTLFSQLESIELIKKPNADKSQIMSKEEMKSMGLKSPDRADSLYYAYAAMFLSNFGYN